MRLTILGSGSSSGIPVVGLGWGACDPENPKNRRLRPSMLLQWDDKTVLIDTSPDLRQQLLNADIGHLDAVVFTHAHADHLHGIDDLRAVNRAMNAPIPIYADRATLEHMETRFAYVLAPLPPDATRYYKPTLEAREITAGTAFDVAGLRVRPFDQDHGYSRTLGFRFGGLGYSTDVVEMTEQGYEALEDVDTWVIGVFTDKPHETHVHVEKALDWIKKVDPRRAILTHLGPDLDYETLSSQIPDRVEVAYDGMIVEAPD